MVHMDRANLHCHGKEAGRRAEGYSAGSEGLEERMDRMRIALYIEDGLEQIVLTPESETEKGICGKLHDGSRSLEILKGSFYQCRGGWVRNGSDDTSTMIVLKPSNEKEEGK